MWRIENSIIKKWRFDFAFRINFLYLNSYQQFINNNQIPF